MGDATTLSPHELRPHVSPSSFGTPKSLDIVVFSYTEEEPRQQELVGDESEAGLALLPSRRRAPDIEGARARKRKSNERALPVSTKADVAEDSSSNRSTVWDTEGNTSLSLNANSSRGHTPISVSSQEEVASHAHQDASASATAASPSSQPAVPARLFVSEERSSTTREDLPAQADVAHTTPSVENEASNCVANGDAHGSTAPREGAATTSSTHVHRPTTPAVSGRGTRTPLARAAKSAEGGTSAPVTRSSQAANNMAHTSASAHNMQASNTDAQAVAALAMLHSSPRLSIKMEEGVVPAAAVMVPSTGPVLVKSDGTTVHLDAALLEHIRLASSNNTVQYDWARVVPGTVTGTPTFPQGLSNADAQAIAALQELGAGNDDHGGAGMVLPPGMGMARVLYAVPNGVTVTAEGCDSPSTANSASGVNSRHGAARGRQVTRACPGCDERISIACKFCTLCGYKFRGSASNKDGSKGDDTREGNESAGRVKTPMTASLQSPKYSHHSEAQTPTDYGKMAATVLFETPGGHGGDSSASSTPAGVSLRARQRKGSVRDVRDDVQDCHVVEMGDDEAGGLPVRPTVTRVTPNSLELHKIKEQERRAREKQLLAKLQTLLFEDKEKAPSASEVTYNYVLECAVQALQERYRGNGTPFVSLAPPMDACESLDSPASQGGGSSRGDMEKHKIKEQLRRARKRQLVTALQNLVLGDQADVAVKSSGITGNYILELVVLELQKGKDERMALVAKREPDV